MEHFNDVFVLSRTEYEVLSNPDTTYSFMTKTAAKKAVSNLLKNTKSTCWHDQNIDPDDWCCGVMCPVFYLLGYDAGDRLCQRQKVFSK